MIYSLEFQFKIFDTVKKLHSKKNDFYTVSEVYKEFLKTEKIKEQYKPILKKRIRSALIRLTDIKKLEKAEHVSEKKVFLYKFKILENE